MPQPIIGPLKSSTIVRRHPDNPVLAAADVPYPTALVFNAGVAKYQGRYVCVFRSDHGSLKDERLDGRTTLGLATSRDGVRWEVSPRPCFEMTGGEILRAYDPRLTVMDGRCYMCFAVDTRHGLRGGSWACRASRSLPPKRRTKRPAATGTTSSSPAG